MKTVKEILNNFTVSHPLFIYLFFSQVPNLFQGFNVFRIYCMGGKLNFLKDFQMYRYFIRMDLEIEKLSK